MEDLLVHHWGDLASVIGLFVSVFGFGLTIVAVRKAKDAARQASEAANATKRSIMAANALVSFGSAMSIMEEIRRLHRRGAWEILPDRYAALKSALISLRMEHPNLSPAHHTAITRGLTQLRGIEKRVEQALEGNVQPNGVANMNSVLSVEIEKIGEVLVSLKQEIKA